MLRGRRGLDEAELSKGFLGRPQASAMFETTDRDARTN
jgi:hypothetical protein